MFIEMETLSCWQNVCQSMQNVRKNDEIPVLVQFDNCCIAVP